MTSNAGQRQLTDALVQTSFVVTAVLARIGAEHDLSLTQLRVLAILRDRRVRMTELADYLGLEKSTMSGLVDRAERRGLLRRTPHQTDRRATEVSLTKQGTALAEQLYPRVAESLAPLLRALPASDTRRLTGLLTAMLGAAER